VPDQGAEHRFNLQRFRYVVPLQPKPSRSRRYSLFCSSAEEFAVAILNSAGMILTQRGRYLGVMAHAQEIDSASKPLGNLENSLGRSVYRFIGLRKNQNIAQSGAGQRMMHKRSDKECLSRAGRTLQQPDWPELPQVFESSGLLVIQAVPGDIPVADF
jgi:hypothetical protein